MQQLSDGLHGIDEYDIAAFYDIRRDPLRRRMAVAHTLVNTWMKVSR